MIKWFKNVFLALDLLLNALLLGDPRETVSSRIGKKRARGGDCRICVWICSLLNLIDDRHCLDAVNWSQGRGSNSDDSVND